MPCHWDQVPNASKHEEVWRDIGKLAEHPSLVTGSGEASGKKEDPPQIPAQGSTAKDRVDMTSVETTGTTDYENTRHRQDNKHSSSMNIQKN